MPPRKRRGVVAGRCCCCSASSRKQQQTLVFLLSFLALFVIACIALQLWFSVNVISNDEYDADLLSPPTITTTTNATAISSTADSYSISFWEELQLPFQNHSLPKWIMDYMEWHRHMRSLYPGTLLWTHPDAPNVLIRFCAKRCGGLHDRLGNLPWDLYLANQTRRVYLILWFYPFRLESFLEPPALSGLNWTVPYNAPHLATAVDVKKHRTKFLLSQEAYRKNRTLAILAATTGELRHEKVLLHQDLGHLREEELELRLQQEHSETDMLHHTLTFGKLFHTLFRPVVRLERRLQEITHGNLQLHAYHYAAVHCRVRHPRNFRPGQAALGKVQPGQTVAIGNADKAGLLFEGELRLQAIAIAKHAVQCTVLMQRLAYPTRRFQPIYFFADSEDLVEYMIHEDGVSMSNETSANSTNMAHAQRRLLSRPLLNPTVHLDRQLNISIESAQDIFLDMYIAMGANCLAFGIGNFGYMASKLSYYARQCRWQHQLPVTFGHTNDFVRRRHDLFNRLPDVICSNETLATLAAGATR